MPPVTTHTIVVKINGVDRSSLLTADSLYIRSSIGNSTDVAELEMRDPSGAFAPADWDEVTVDVNGVRIFGGYIVQRNAGSVGAGAAKRAVWSVTCKDWSILLDRVLVNKQFRGTPDNVIAITLFGLYMSGEGFGALVENMVQVKADIDINFEEITLREALNELASRSGANWHIAPDKKVYWYSPSAPATAAFNISQTPNNTTTFAPLDNTLQRAVDASQIVNRVRVIGAEAASTVLQEDVFPANGTDSVFGPLTKKPHSLWLVQYVVHTGGNDVNVSAYASQIGTEPNDKLLVDGGTYTVVANLDNRTIKVTDVGGLLPKAGTNVTVKYYYTTPIETVRDDSASQTQFGRVFETSIYDESLTTVKAAQEYGDAILAQYAFGRETVSFQVTRHGLLPGRKITVTSSTMGLSGDFLIQEVQFAAIAVQNDKFMVVASVQCGAFIQTLIETLRPSYSAGAGRVPASANGKVSNIAASLGDIVAGRMIMTDGGTARFNWGTPNGATGIVLGLEDIDNNAYGAQYIYEGGTVRAKVGRLTGLPSIGSITPVGWGIYTTNGYFSGQVVASQVIGGSVVGGKMVGGTIEGVALVGQTIEGAQITGGTVRSILLDSAWIQGGTIDMMHGSIGGFTIDGQHLWSNGGTISTGSVVNSANPGVYLTSSGLFGFGTLGMTFGLWSDPAKKPWFSSGTINNVVYEVYESGVIRTGPDVFNDGGVQIDNSGVFGVNPITGAASLLLENGDKLLQESGQGIELYGLRFALDSVTGKLYAEDAYIQGAIYANEGRFTGTVSASQIVGGTITGAKLAGAQIIGQTISGSDIVGGTITGVPIANAGITNGSLDSSLILGGTMTAAQIVGGTVTGGVFTGGTVSQGTIAAALITGANISGGTISAPQISGGTITGMVISAADKLVTLGTAGLDLYTNGSENRMRWILNGQPIVQQYSLYYYNYYRFFTWMDPVSGTPSMMEWMTTNLDGNSYTVMQLMPGFLKFGSAINEAQIDFKWIVSNTEAVCYVTLRPDTSGARSLGDSTRAWRYLYLSDGTDEWRISVNTSGSIVTTKV